MPCEGDELHWFCKPCFRNYLTVTGTKGAGATQVKCPSCKALVGTDHVKGCLSAWELEDLEARAAERDAAVALRSDVAARLECVCGARGRRGAEGRRAVWKSTELGSTGQRSSVRDFHTGDEPEDGIVQCRAPGKPCERSYCIKCGAHAHPGKPCEDVDEDEDVLKALGSDTKRCPACGNGITKVGGCNHVLCAPPGGCGKSFCFICLQPHESHDPAKCRGGQQAHDLMMAHRPSRRPRRCGATRRRSSTRGAGASRLLSCSTSRCRRRRARRARAARLPGRDRGRAGAARWAAAAAAPTAVHQPTVSRGRAPRHERRVHRSRPAGSRTRYSVVVPAGVAVGQRVPRAVAGFPLSI